MKRSVLVLAVLMTVNWLALPPAAAADNCQNMGADERDRECSIPEKVIGFFTGLAIMAGWASKYHNPKPKNRNQLNQWGQAAAPKPPPKQDQPSFSWKDPGTWL